ncbi:MAG: 6-phosphofructokinase [Chthonomonadales bacterium]|nr:6-phosphofructokinase [Chthonomonadales bacterium]
MTDGANGSSPQGKLAILVGGGPAPGINGVISGATLEALRHGLEVIGIYDGFKWLAAGDGSHTCKLTAEVAEDCRLKGGSILRTSREKPADDPDKMANVVATLRGLGVGYLVTIGGDDTAYSALKTAATSGGDIQVAHVPKTIDNDLPLPDQAPTFGYNTARSVGADLIRNLMEDARTTKRWFVVSAMGRSAGHLALGMARSGGASLAVIPEQFAAGKVDLNLVLSIIEGAMLKAKALGHDYGVAVVAEGVGEFLASELQGRPYVEITHDKSGNLRLAEVPLALILKKELQARAKAAGRKVTIVDITIGYELRCAPPIPFDSEYVQQLGWGAVQYVLGRGAWEQGGALISLRAGVLEPIPFGQILDPKTGKTAIRRVDVGSHAYASARAQMMRLEPSDLENAELVAKMAKDAGIEPQKFVEAYRGAAEA